MNFKSMVSLLSCYALSTASLAIITPSSQAEQAVRFICENGVDPQDNKFYPTTYAVTSNDKIPVVRWKYKWFGDSAVVLQGRCQTASSAFQAAYNNGSLSYITNIRDDGQPVICATGRFLGSCVTPLFALRSSDDALEAIAELKEALKGESNNLPLPRFTIIPQVYVSIDMEQLLTTTPIEKK